MASTDSTFAPGDIIELNGETYQVLENHGTRGVVIPFPSDNMPSEVLPWQSAASDCRRIGKAQLPVRTGCGCGGGCSAPSGGTPIAHHSGGRR